MRYKERVGAGVATRGVDAAVWLLCLGGVEALSLVVLVPRVHLRPASDGPSDAGPSSCPHGPSLSLVLSPVVLDRTGQDEVLVPNRWSPSTTPAAEPVVRCWLPNRSWRGAWRCPSSLVVLVAWCWALVARAPASS